MKQFLQRLAERVSKISPKPVFGGFWRSKKLFKVSLVALLLIVGVIFVPRFVFAQTADTGYLMTLLGWIFQVIVTFLGWLLVMLINFVSGIFQYNDFLSARVVTIGWPLVRDLCNMFFVVALLLISFGTILNIPNYHFKSALPKLLLAAILVNFSKTILGLCIDFSQVIMLTFVNSFKDALATNITNSFGLTSLLNLNKTFDKEVSDWSIIVTLLTAIVILVIAIGVIAVYAFVLLWRILTLWVLLVLSPLAFLLGAIPGTASSKAGEFWTKFWSQLTTGVVLAFFMWLVLAVLADISSEADSSLSQQLLKPETINSSQIIGQTGIAGTGVAAKVNYAKDPWQMFYGFLVAVGLLMLSLTYAQQAGGAAGAFAGKVSGGLASVGKGALKRLPGVRFAKETYGSYKETREKARSRKYKDFGVKLAGARAGLTLGAAGLVGAGIKWAQRKPFGILSSTRHKEQAEKLDNQVTLIKSIGSLMQRYTRSTSTEGKKKIEDQLKVLLETNKDALSGARLGGILLAGQDGTETASSASAVARGLSDIATQGLGSAAVETTRGKLQEKATFHRRFAMYSNIGAGVIGTAAIAGATFLIPGGSIVAGAVAGGILGPKIMALINNQKKRTGAAGVEYAQNYHYHEIQEEKKDMKGLDKNELREIWNNSSETDQKRTASFLELLERKELTADETQAGKEKIHKQFGIGDKTVATIEKMQRDQNPAIQPANESMSGMSDDRLKKIWQKENKTNDPEIRQRGESAFLELLRRKALADAELQAGFAQYPNQLAKAIAKLTQDIKLNPNMVPSLDSGRREPTIMLAAVRASLMDATSATAKDSIFNVVQSAPLNQKPAYQDGLTRFLDGVRDVGADGKGNRKYMYVDENGQSTGITKEEIVFAFKTLAASGYENTHEYLDNVNFTGVNGAQDELFKDVDFVLNLNPKFLMGTDGKPDEVKIEQTFQSVAQNFNPNELPKLFEEAKKRSHNQPNIQRLVEQLFSPAILDTVRNKDEVVDKILEDGNKAGEQFDAFFKSFDDVIKNSRSAFHDLVAGHRS